MTTSLYRVATFLLTNITSLSLLLVFTSQHCTKARYMLAKCVRLPVHLSVTVTLDCIVMTKHVVKRQ